MFCVLGTETAVHGASNARVMEAGGSRSEVVAVVGRGVFLVLAVSMILSLFQWETVTISTPLL